MGDLFTKAVIMDMLSRYIPKIAMALLFLIIGFWVAGLLTRWAKRRMEKRAVEVSIRPFFASIINVGLKILVLISVAGIFGVPTTSFAAVIGAATLAIGLALQGSLGHFASGVLLLTFKPYSVGEIVEIKGCTGKVEEIQLFNTVLRTPDNKKIIIPNGVVTSDVIKNISGQGTIRVDMTYGIGYDSDVEKARQLALDVVRSNPHVLKDPEPLVLLKEWGSSSVNLIVLPWCKSEHYRDVYFYVQENLKKAFEANNIEIPYNRMDVKVEMLESKNGI
jgi:small conductance mechanosensitive channel